MKLIKDKQREAVEKCLLYHIPFALFALPGEKECRFFASLPDPNGESHAFDTDNASESEGDTFFISFFNGDEPYMAGVRRTLDEVAVINAVMPEDGYRQPELFPYRVSTRRRTYSEAFSRMKDRLRTHGGKVVLSRHEALFSYRPVIDVVDQYLSGSSDTFRYLCQTPETGIWFGATPELLLSADTRGTEFHTMALAGTLPIDSTEGWDDKNIREHAYVADYISHSLSQLGLSVSAGVTDEVNAGAVRHLRTLISATGNANPFAVADLLNPTPAVAGIPTDVAIAEIDTYENHRRRCYSGLTGVCLDGRFHAFVNLRCAFVAPAAIDGKEGWLYNLYAGGGIMSDSVEETEWQETEQKLAVLKSIILLEQGLPAERDLRDASFTDSLTPLPF